MSGAPSTPLPSMNSNPEEQPGSYAGWYIGAAATLLIFAVMMGIWFVYHP